MSDHIFFPIDNSYYTEQYKEVLNLEFDIENNESYPINIMENPFFNIDTIISDIFESELSSDIIKKNTLIMQAPDELIDFSKLDFSQLTSLTKLAPQFRKELELKQKFDLENFPKSNFLTKFQMILPIFIRCQLEEVNKKEFIESSNLVLRDFPDHSIATILKIFIYARMILISKNPNEIKFNLENALTKINMLIQKLCDDDQENNNEEILSSMLPILLPRVTEIVCAASFFAFDVSLDTEPTKFNLYNLLGQFFIIIASNYPPSFDKTGWQTFSKYFSRIGSTKLIESKSYPDYTFILKYPHLVEPNIVACCVTDLLNSFNLLSYLGLNLPNDKKNQVYSVLIKLIHWNQSFARSATRSFINLTRFSFFKNAINEYKQDLESSESSNFAAILYELMTAYNFTEDFFKFEIKNKFTTIVLEKTNVGTSYGKRKHLNGFQKLFNLNTTNITSIFEAAQLVNGIAIQFCNDDNENLVKLALILHENQFLRYLEKFLIEYIQNKTFLDLKFAQPFIVLASRYIQVRSTIVSLSNSDYLGMNVELVLNLYSAILLAGPALNNRKQEFTTLAADLYFGRSIITNSIHKNCQRFLFIASEYLKSRRMSLLEPFLLFLSDYFTFNPFVVNLYNDIVDNLIEFLNIALLTESTIVSKAIINIYIQICKKAPLEASDSLITSLIKQFEMKFKSKKEELREITKILYIIKEISATPHGKISILSNSSIQSFSEVLYTIIQDKHFCDVCEYLTINCFQLITNLCCPALTLNRDLDFILRCGSEILPNIWIENITSSISSYIDAECINNHPEKVAISAVQTLRYICENPFIVKFLTDVKTFKLNINELQKTKVFDDPEFYVTLLELISTIVNVDSEFACELIGFNKNEKVFRNDKFKKEKIAGDLYNMFKKGDSIKKYPNYLLNAIQKQYNQSKQRYNNEKLKKYTSPLPPNTSTAYMGDLPSKFYEEYVECYYKKKK